MFFTSGDDRIFPKGMPVGKVTVVRAGRTFKEIFLVPAAFQQGLEEVLVVIEGINGVIPDAEQQRNTANPEVYLQPQEAPKPGSTPAATPAEGGGQTPISGLSTDADRIRERYKVLGEQQGVKYGEGGKIPNFNATQPPSSQPPAAGASKPAAPGTTAPGTAGSRPIPPATAPGTAAPSPLAPKPQPQQPATGANPSSRSSGTVTVQPRAVPSGTAPAPTQPRQEARPPNP